MMYHPLVARETQRMLHAQLLFLVRHFLTLLQNPRMLETTVSVPVHWFRGTSGAVLFVNITGRCFPACKTTVSMALRVNVLEYDPSLLTRMTPRNTKHLSPAASLCFTQTSSVPEIV